MERHNSGAEILSRWLRFYFSLFSPPESLRLAKTYKVVYLLRALSRLNLLFNIEYFSFMPWLEEMRENVDTVNLFCDILAKTRFSYDDGFRNALKF